MYSAYLNPNGSVGAGHNFDMMDFQFDFACNTEVAGRFPATNYVTQQSCKNLKTTHTRSHTVILITVTTSQWNLNTWD